MSELISSGLRELVKLMGEQGHDLVGGFLGGDYGYGTDYDSDVFMMHHYCWCDQDDCPWCGWEMEHEQAPNFHHKSTGFKVWWYKYIGRGMRIENPQNADFVKILAECMDSIRQNDGH